MAIKIDSHQHFWQYHPVNHAWIDDSMKKIRRDFLPADLAPVLKTNGIDGCIAVQADQTEKETSFLLQCAAAHNFIKAVVGWVDLRSPQVGDQLEYFSKNPLFKGVRHIVQGEAVDFMLQKNFQQGIAKLADFGLTYDILIYPHQLEAAISLAKTFPDQAFVLDHIAKPKISEGMDNSYKKHITTLASLGNVYCKVSGMVTETANFSWKKEDFTIFLDLITTAFGTDKIMYGSDWPVCLVAGSYTEVLDIAAAYYAGFSKTEQDKIMGTNALDFYNITNRG